MKNLVLLAVFSIGTVLSDGNFPQLSQVQNSKISNVAMPDTGVASMSSFKDSDMTDCGKKKDPDGSFRSHGPLVAMNHYFYDQYYTAQTKQDQLWHIPEVERPPTGMCNDLCFELTAKRNGDGNNGPIPQSPIVVKVGDRCGDGEKPDDEKHSWCDADNNTPSSYSRKMDGPWKLSDTTFVHFDLMCMSLNKDNATHFEWLKYGLKDCYPDAQTFNFLIDFKRVPCT
jgi:hypothetical protein